MDRRQKIEKYFSQYLDDTFKKKGKHTLYNFFRHHTHRNKFFEAMSREMLGVEMKKNITFGPVEYRNLVRDMTRLWCLQIINLKEIEVNPQHQKKIVKENEMLDIGEAGEQDASESKEKRDVVRFDSADDIEKALDNSVKERKLVLDDALLQGCLDAGEGDK